MTAEEIAEGRRLQDAYMATKATDGERWARALNARLRWLSRHAEELIKVMERQRPSRPRDLKPCGTYAAYQRHLRHGEKPDAECRAAATAYKRQFRTQEVRGA